MAGNRRVNVPLGERGYDVVVAGGLDGLGGAVRDATSTRRVVLVTDATVDAIWGDRARRALGEAALEVATIVVPPGEAHKTVETWWRIVDGALRAGVRRTTPIVALGGGVVGDLAGFAAASVLRGVPFVQVPTTLLAMVDSSVGGKTGFDHPMGKNLVGAFWQPALVWTALDTLATLPSAELRSGLGEVAKTALLADPALVEDLEARGAEVIADPERAADVVARCVSAKAAIVASDEREVGARAALNAGHTFGHAVEQVAGFGVVPHGEAVAMGLAAETAWAEREGLLDSPGFAMRVRRLLQRLGLEVDPPRLPVGELVAAMRLDKKGGGDTLSLPVVRAPGSWCLVDLPLERLVELVPR